MNEQKDLLKRLHQRRGSLKTKLTLFKKYLDQFESKAVNGSLKKTDFKEISNRYDKIQSVIIDFDELQNSIDCESEDNESEISERETFENLFHLLISTAETFIDQYVPSNNANASSSISVHSSNVSCYSAPIKLPTISLPSFDGDYTKWFEFHDTFISLIHNTSISKVQKFHYLKAALKGDASKLIESIELSDSNYDVAWRLICERYENKRLLTYNHIKTVFNIPKIDKENSSKLRNLIDTVSKHLRIIDSLIPADKKWDAFVIFLITSKLDATSAREWEALKIDDEFPTFEILRTFLQNKADLLETLQLNHSQKGNFSSSTSKDSRCRSDKHRTLLATTDACAFCKGSHKISSCEELVKLSVPERLEKIKSKLLCINCLRKGHFISDCKSGFCRKCKLKHHTLLHIDKVQPAEETSSCSLSFSNQFSSQSQQVLLATVQVYVQAADGAYHNCRALLDCGSQSNLITKRLFNLLKLDSKCTNISLTGITSGKCNITSKCMVNARSQSGNFEINFLCYIIPSICDSVPTQNINVSNLNIPQNIRLSDPHFGQASSVDLLIGSEIFWQLLCIGQIKLGVGLPTLQKTRFGWVVVGSAPSMKPCSLQCNIIQENDIQNQLKRFWELEECERERTLSNEEHACEAHFVEHTKRTPDGRFVVSIPFKESISKLGDSRKRALKQFYSLEKRLQANDLLRERYNAFMDEYINLGHMTRSSNNSQISYYFPHHGVTREESLTTKLRVVFNGSAPSDTGFSLNQLQMVGPVIQDDIFSILLRFRQHAYIIVADIIKMYRQVLVDPSQRSLQRIFWRPNPAEALQEYELATVTYGTASGSFLAIRCIHQLAKEHADVFPIASRIIMNDFYVDDLISGASSISEAKILCAQISYILKQGCFDLRKWVSNELEILNEKEQIGLSLEKLDLSHGESTKTLGISWEPTSDTILYSINSINTPHVTKRIILSCISQIFDPLGLLSACTIQAKLILQKLWLENISWDEALPEYLHSQWQHFYQHLSELNNLRISRFVICKNAVEVELHAFCDASMNAYGTCVYARSVNVQSDIHSNILCAKSKVAPLKVVSIPRLELCAAQLAAKLVAKIIKTSQTKFSKVYIWTDSTIVLSWIHTPPNNLKTFVCNRVAEIQNLCTNVKWRHVRSLQNPADILSRGISAASLKDHNLWWSGPSWLIKTEEEWPESHYIRETNLPELRKTSQVFLSQIIEILPIENFSSLHRLKRTTGYCLRYLYNLRNPSNHIIGPLTVDELNKSLVCLVKQVQQSYFSLEYRQLKNSIPLSSKSKILSLNPFLDEYDIIRVGGRLRNTNYSFNKKHPILLPAHHHFTILIFRAEHIKLFHAGPQHLLASVRETFWPISGRNIAKRVTHECIKCFKAKPRSAQALMGDLPSQRVKPSPPFSITGADFAGPFLTRDRRGRGYKTHKTYICIFICFATKAMHLELVTDLTKDAFIATLRRFISRRGKPLEIFSDNGTNFVGANNELLELNSFLNQNQNNILEHCSEHGIKWHFIPPHSPHMGGLWEAGVKSVKWHLKRISANALLTFEELTTLLVQIEAILNSRPLTPVSVDPDDFTPLTPAHFLIGRPLTTVADPDLTRLPENRLSHYQRIQQLQQNFWSRWSKEYLASLQERQKWRRQHDNIPEGSLVLIKEDNLPPLQWQLGRVICAHPGKDSITRVVSIKTSKGTIKRSVAKICPLPCFVPNVTKQESK